MVKMERDRRWYYWYRFPLVPIFDYRPSDDYNPFSFVFSWLFIRAWTLSSLQFGIDFNFSGRGCYLRVLLPYFQIYFWFIILPERWEFIFSRKGKLE